jgi:hypothetical protein
MWAVCEAKGSSNASGWIRGTPAPVKTGLGQIDRIEVRDSGGVLASEGWVVASRWGTVDNGLPPVIMTVDPRNDGRILSAAEVDRAEAELRVDWYADLLMAVGQENVASRLKGGAVAIADDERGLARIGDTVGYAALAIDGAGLFPLVSEAREDLRRALVRFARDSGQKTAVIIIDREGVERARNRQIADPAMTSPDGFPEVEDDETKTSDLAGGIDNPIISIDGVTLTWDVDQIDLKPV